MPMTTTKIEEKVRNDFIESLIRFSDEEIGRKEAINIANRKLRLSDFLTETPVAHKGVRWLAKTIVRDMGIID